MAIVKRPSGKYQAKLQGVDGQWICRSFQTRKEAESYEFHVKQQKHQGTMTTNTARGITLDQFFVQWFETVKSRASDGWRKEQRRLYVTYISPVMGKYKLEAISPQLVARVLNQMADLGKSEQMQLHVFGLLRKMFGDAIEMFRLLTHNPALKTLKPSVPEKEAAHLNLAEIKKLLWHVQGRTYGVPIWVQLFLGLRSGELQALRWQDVDLTDGIVSIRRAFVRLERRFRDYPKGKRQHSHRIPHELLTLLREERKKATSSFVALSPSGEMLSYEHYSRRLKRYCKELEIRTVGTHGLRHSTSVLYLSHGANQDDIRQLFAHSSNVVTERYIHHRGTNLEKVAQEIQLFPGSSPNLPQEALDEVDFQNGDVLSNEINKRFFDHGGVAQLGEH